MIRLAVISAMWGRFSLVEIMLDNLARLRERLSGRLELACVVAGSETYRSRSLVIQRGFEYVETRNRPLGAKWSTALRRARLLEPDGVMVLGSDNLVNAELLRCWAALFEIGYDYLGILDAYQYNIHHGTLIHWDGYKSQGPNRIDRTGEPIGSSRAFSRRLLDQMSWRIWNEEANRGLDWSTTQALKEVPHRAVRIRQDSGALRHLGVKAQGAMSPSLHKSVKNRLEPELLLEWYGDEIGQRVLDLAKSPSKIAPPGRQTS